MKKKKKKGNCAWCIHVADAGDAGCFCTKKDNYTLHNSTCEHFEDVRGKKENS